MYMHTHSGGNVGNEDIIEFVSNMIRINHDFVSTSEYKLQVILFGPSNVCQEVIRFVIDTSQEARVCEARKSW